MVWTGVSMQEKTDTKAAKEERVKVRILRGNPALLCGGILRRLAASKENKTISH